MAELNINGNAINNRLFTISLTDPDGPPADEYTSFGAYQRSLSLKCDEGEPGVIHWRPDENTPDTAYYQCFTHRYLGWKINVLDSCEQEQKGQASEIDEVYAAPDDTDMMEAEASIQHETKVKPDDVFLLQHEVVKDRTVDAPRKNHFESHKSLEISKIIADGIRAAEALEESIKTNATDEETPLATESNEVTTDEVRETIEPLPTFLTPPRGQTIRPFRYDGRQPTKGPNYPFRQPQSSLVINHYKKPGPQVIRLLYKDPTQSIKPAPPALIYREKQPVRKTYIEPRNPDKIPLPPPPPTVPLRRDYVSNFNKRPIQPYQKHAPHVPLRKAQIFRNPINGPKNKFHGPYSIKKPVNSDQITTLNDGFRPASVVVESGFMPITKNHNHDESIEPKEVGEEQYDDEYDDQPVDQKLRRSDQFDEETIDSDALFPNSESDEIVKSFEPMFVPSPLDSTNQTAAKKLADDLNNMEMEEGEDKLAMAGERHDAYYLPPDNRKSSVVTYDGKSVDMPGPAPPAAGNVRSRISSTEQLLNSPQFGVFRGELPPLRRS